MTRIVVQRGSSSSSSSSSSSNQNRSSTSPPSPLSSLAPLQSQATGSPQSQANSTSPQSQANSTSPQSQATGTSPQSQATGTSPQSQATGASPQSQATVKDGNLAEVQEQNVLDDLSDHCAVSDNKSEDHSPGGLNSNLQGEKLVEDEIERNDDSVGPGDLVKGETDAMVGSSFQKIPGSSYPPPPPPPMPSSLNFTFRRSPSADPVAIRIGPSRRPALPGVSIRSPPTESRPSSPRSHCEGEGYNSADEQSPSFGLGFDDAEKERQFVIDLRRGKGLEVRKMLEDGNCLFRAVADQVYGDSDLYDSVRQMCIDYMERERDHFSQFITEGFTPYCKRKRRDKVYGNNVEIQALSEMYNRPIHIYSYSTEPINIFHGNYHTDEPPILLSYHRGNHYNSLVDPRRRTIGAGLGYSSLRGTDIDEGKIKAAIKAQQDQQIDNALLAEGRLYSDIELTEKEMERTVIEASRAEYLASDMFKQQVGPMESSTSGAEPSSSAARASGSVSRQEGERDQDQGSSQVLSSSMQVLLSMGFSYLQVVEAYSIFGDNVDSMICYLIETSSDGRNKGKATET